MPFEPVQFGKYTLYEKLAVGGMALLYRARIQGVKGFQKDLVIKQILPQYSGMADFIDMFIDEAKIAVNLNHANIVPVYELGEIDGQLYIAMEYVAGRDLQAILEACEDKKTSVPPRVAAYILMGACRGLDYAHNKKDDATRQPLNIIHRDISPNNVIVSFEGEVKIIDFGIAKASIKVSVTQFGTLKGKMVYMSPEQAAEHKLDPRSDVFSAGILLYELVTGKKPYGSDNFVLTQENVKKASFPPPDKVNPTLPPAMTQIILKAMAREPAERYQSAFEFERALTDFLFSTGQNVYARDVAAFLQDLFTENTDEKLVEPAKSGIKNLTDGGKEGVTTDTQPRGLTPGSLTPTGESSLENPQSPDDRLLQADDPSARLDQSKLPTDVIAEEPVQDTTNAGILGALPDEGPAIDEGTESGASASRAAEPQAPEMAPTPSPAGGRALLGDEPFDFEIPPPPVVTQEPAPSQRETVVTRRLPQRQPIPTAPLEKNTPVAGGREGVVPAAARADATHTNPSASGDIVAGEGSTETTSSSGLGVTDLAGVVPGKHGDEETAPGAAARDPSGTLPPMASPMLSPRATPSGSTQAPLVPPPSAPSTARTSPTNPSGVRPPSPPATARPAAPAPPRDVTPPRGTRAPSPGVLPTRPAFAETPVSPPGGRPNPLASVQPVSAAPPAPPSSPPPRPPTPDPPWQTDLPAKRGLLDRITGRGKPGAAPVTPAPTPEEVTLEGTYESPADFLNHHFETYGTNNNRGLFLSTTQLDAKLGVNIPLRLHFTNPPSSFLVHGRVIWRRAKDGTSKGKRLPAGLAIEFADDLSDELEALYAYLGLP